jgi:hypothetical protein
MARCREVGYLSPRGKCTVCLCNFRRFADNLFWRSGITLANPQLAARSTMAQITIIGIRGDAALAIHGR